MRECTRRLAENVVHATRLEPAGKLPHTRHVMGSPESGIAAGKAMYHRFYGKKD